MGSLNFKLFFVFCILLLISCSSWHNNKVRLDAEDQFRLGKIELKLRHYDKAIENFKYVMFEYPGSKWVEESQYWLAKSYFEKEDYVQAELEYSFFLRSFPRSRFIDDTELELSLCYFKESPSYQLDQTLTLKALQGFDSFLIKYADSELIDEAKKYRNECIDKLVKRDLKIAKSYIKIGHSKSAIVYLEAIQQNYPDNSYSKEVTSLIESINR
ncbi:outer membrane protein assembly factor BamD [candidate division WOR-3 bacterium]|nr:outer membrane protein assembly factor BamD [candidate division WOR-3 bacterium]